jgi:hypothetical protein
VWLAAIALFFIFTRSRNIKVIPASLCALALATSFGPWGAYAVAERSQTHRLAELFTRNDVLAGGRVAPAEGDVSFEDRREMSAVLDYLLLTHGDASIEDWFGGELPSGDTVARGEAAKESEAAERAQAILSFLRIEYVDRWQAEEPARFSYFLAQDSYVLPVAGFDYAFKLNRQAPRTVRLDGADYTVGYDTLEAAVVLRRPGSRRVIAAPLTDLLDHARAYPRERGSARVEDPELLMVEVDNERARLRVYFNSLTGRLRDGRPHVDSFDATLYVTLEKPDM